MSHLIKKLIPIRKNMMGFCGRDVMIIIIAVLALTLPFVNKAFDWDDREFIEFAQVFAQDPLQFHLQDLGYRGQFYEEFRTTHPPVVSWYMSLFLRLGFDVSEPVFRLAFIVFPLIAAFSMYALARRFTKHALIAALLLAVSPGFLVSAHTLMGDLPGLSLWLASVALFIWGADKNSWKLLLSSGVVMALASLTAYQALSVVPLLLFYALVKRRFRLRVFLPLVIPVVVFAVYTIYIQHKYGAWPRFAYSVGTEFGWREPGQKIRALMAFTGGSIIFPLALVPLLFRKKVDILVAFLLLPPLITWTVFYYLALDQLTLYQSVWLSIFVVAGFAVLCRMLAEPIRNLASYLRRREGSADSLFILAWFGGVVFYVGVFLPFVAARFLLPLFPVVALLVVREFESLWPLRPRARSVYMAAVMVLTLSVGLGAAVADYRLAGAGREAAREMAQKYSGTQGGLWVLSEFGFRYYMQDQGFAYLGVNAEARPGDLVVASQINSEQVLAPLPEGFYEIVERQELQDGFPLRLLNSAAGAGFYAHLVGPLPYVVSQNSIDTITVYRLKWEE